MTSTLPAVQLESKCEIFVELFAVRGAMQSLRKNRSFEAVAESLVSLSDYNEIVGLTEQQAREDGFSAAARDLMAPR